MLLAHLRLAGSDVFGQGTFDRPWHQGADELTLARRKADAAFGLFTRLGVPFYTFHDTDVAPEGENLAQYRSNLAAMVDVLAQKQEATGVKLLWGTANLFSHRALRRRRRHQPRSRRCSPTPPRRCSAP